MRRTKVLLVSDDASLREKALGALRNHRCEVHSLRPSRVDPAEDAPPDVLIVASNSAPVSLHRRLTDGAWSDVPTAVLTGDDEARAEVEDDGIRALAPSCDADELVRTVTRLGRASRLILVADDEPLIRRMYRRFLEEQGYRVAEATDGQEAIDRVTREVPDLVITDIKMPHADGYDVCRRIKESKETEHIPVIITSALSSELDIDRGFLVGANEYLTKPVDLAELGSRIDAIFRGIESRGRETILVIAPDPIERSMIEYGLSQQGFEAVVLLDPEEALGRATEIRPSLVIVDVELSDLPLEEVCSRLADEPTLEAVPVVAMTARSARIEVPADAEADGPAAVLTKPFPMEKLVAVVERILGERRTRLELERELLLHTITSLVRTLEARDPYTRGHSENVARYSLAVARRMFDQPERLKHLRLGALLHDIGKVGIRDDILMKPGRLTPEEYEIVKAHPTTGAEILEPIPSLAPIIPIVRWHHERIDGEGYPDGLSGEEIPLSVKIISAADTFDALTSDRPYREALPAERAVEILQEVAGTQLSETVVEEFVALDPVALLEEAREATANEPSGPPTPSAGTDSGSLAGALTPE